MTQPIPERDGEAADGAVARRARRVWLGAAVGGALIVAGVIAYAALSDPGEPSEAGASGMTVEVNAPAPPAPVTASGPPMEVLSPDIVHQPLAMAPPPAPSEPEPEPAPPEEPSEFRNRASFDCATARPGAEQMVCADPSLAAADLEMAQAYRRALRAGVPADDLRMEQRDWIALREDAARRSPQAVAAIYFQRIDDLNGIADDYAEPAPPPRRRYLISPAYP